MIRVLTVDDAMFMRHMLKNILTNNGIEVVGEAENGLDAFEKYKALKPDVVTMDITMPNVNGIDGVKLIKEYDSAAKIIMCSAMGQEGLVVDSIRAGARDFVVKPFKEDKLLESIQRVAAI